VSIALDIVAKILVKYWHFIVIGLLFALLLLTCNKNTDLRNKNQKSQGELQSMALDISRSTQEATISKKGFREILKEKKELQWVLDSLKKNPKTITEIQYIRTEKYSRDTVKIITSDFEGLMINRASYNTCGLEVDFMWFNMDTIGDFSVKDKTELAIVTTDERKRLFNWNWTPRWGERQYEITVLTSCGDSIITNYKLTKEK